MKRSVRVPIVFLIRHEKSVPACLIGKTSLNVRRELHNVWSKNRARSSDSLVHCPWFRPSIRDHAVVGGAIDFGISCSREFSLASPVFLYEQFSDVRVWGPLSLEARRIAPVGEESPPPER